MRSCRLSKNAQLRQRSLLVKYLNRIVNACAFAAFLLTAGCDSFTPFTYDVSGLVKNEAGEVSAQGSAASATVKKRKAVGSFVAVGVGIEGRSIKVEVAATKPDALVLDVSLPDAPAERVEIARGQNQDVFPDGKNLGVRIHVK